MLFRSNDAKQLEIAQQNANTNSAEFALKKKLSEVSPNLDVFTPFANYIDNQWNSTVLKNKTAIDYTNKDQTIKQLNSAYSGIGYNFNENKEDNTQMDITKKVTDKDGKTVNEIIATIPITKGARNQIKKTIITDKASSDEGTNSIIGLYQSGALNEVNPTKKTTTNDPLGIR